MEKRKARLIINKSAGTAASGSKTYRVTLPNSWVEEMNIGNSREIELSFDGRNITVSKRKSIDGFISERKNHNLIKLKYYNFNSLCTVVVADYTECEIAIENFTSECLYCAFGKNEAPNWQDYLQFLESRCVSENRDRIRDYLEAIGVTSYEPIEIIKKTEGRMAEDNQWLTIELLSEPA